jgi:hypothetical protein
MPDKLTQLLEIASDADKVELKIRSNAKVACLKAVADEPTAANQKNLNAAEANLISTIERLWGAYFPDEEKFDKIADAHIYLINKGYKISPSKFYEACNGSKSKKLKPVVPRQKDGSILKRDLLLYAKSLKYLGDPAAGLDQAQKRKLALEAEKLERQNALLEWDLRIKEGAYISRADAEMARAAAISIIEANIRNLHLTLSGEWIRLVEGNPDHTPRLIDAMGDALNDLFNRLARMEEFTVELN